MTLLALQESYSLSVLLYASPALLLTCKQISELNVCWNGVICRIFGYHKWESVRALICELCRLNVAYELLVRKAKYYKRLYCKSGFLNDICWMFLLSDMCRVGHIYWYTPLVVVLKVYIITYLYLPLPTGIPPPYPYTYPITPLSR